MPSVTGRISQIKQPYGGFLPVKTLTKEIFEDNYSINDSANIPDTIIGLATDYLTRVMLGEHRDIVFDVSYRGALYAGKIKNHKALVKEIDGLSDSSIISACKLSSYDVWYRNPSYGPQSPTEDQMNPDASTIDNIRTYVNRTLDFFAKQGPVIKNGFDFEGAYTEEVSSGDGDFLTEDGLWDLKVRKSSINSKHSLQILMYWIMGQHSYDDCFKNISKIGIFNPRTNMAYWIEISSIPKDVIRKVETEVIGYNDYFIFAEDADKTIQRERQCFIFDCSRDVHSFVGDDYHEHNIYYSCDKIPYIKESYLRWQVSMSENHGTWYVKRNKKQNNDQFGDICKLAISNRVADIVVREMPSGSTLFHIRDANPTAYARLAHFLLKTGLAQRTEKGDIKGVYDLYRPHMETYGFHDFINMKTGRFKAEYKEVGKEEFDMNPKHVVVREYSYEWD